MYDWLMVADLSNCVMGKGEGLDDVGLSHRLHAESLGESATFVFLS